MVDRKLDSKAEIYLILTTKILAHHNMTMCTELKSDYHIIAYNSVDHHRYMYKLQPVKLAYSDSWAHTYLAQYHSNKRPAHILSWTLCMLVATKLHYWLHNMQVTEQPQSSDSHYWLYLILKLQTLKKNKKNSYFKFNNVNEYFINDTKGKRKINT